MALEEVTKEELTKILAAHEIWLADNSKGRRADLSYINLSSANLSYADLRFANLSCADLRSANLRSANLRSANLRSADLRSADLSFANLRSADLSCADLSFADLRSANLSCADLRSADLSCADLRSADLSFANLHAANLLSFQFNKHVAYFTIDGTLSIGCERLPITEWVICFKEIGKANDYSDLEIEAYGDFIKMCLKVFNSNASQRARK